MALRHCSSARQLKVWPRMLTAFELLDVLPDTPESCDWLSARPCVMFPGFVPTVFELFRSFEFHPSSCPSKGLTTTCRGVTLPL